MRRGRYVAPELRANRDLTHAAVPVAMTDGRARIAGLANTIGTLLQPPKRRRQRDQRPAHHRSQRSLEKAGRSGIRL